jgi:hypothetical protein
VQQLRQFAEGCGSSEGIPLWLRCCHEKRMMMAKGGIEGGFSTKLSEFSIPRAPFAYHNVLSDFNPGQGGRALMKCW